MASMLTTVWLIISAMAFGGVMEYTGLLAKIMEPLLRRAKSDRSLVASAGLTAIGMNVLAGDQYMSIVLPGRMFRDLFHERESHHRPYPVKLKIPEPSLLPWFPGTVAEHTCQLRWGLPPWLTSLTVSST